MKKLIVTLLATIIASTSYVSYAAVSGEQLINVQDSTQTFILSPRRVKDAGDAADNLTKGVLACGPFVFDGTNWDKARGDATFGLDVDVTRISGSATVIGDDTPADNYANPTDFVGTWSLLGTFDGSTWDRVRSGVITGQILTDNSSNAFSNITTNTSTVVKNSAGVMNRMNVNVIGTTSNVRLYNDASAPCDTNFVMQLDTTVLTSSVTVNHTFTTGICALTAGGAAADITITYR